MTLAGRPVELTGRVQPACRAFHGGGPSLEQRVLRRVRGSRPRRRLPYPAHLRQEAPPQAGERCEPPQVHRDRASCRVPDDQSRNTLIGPARSSLSNRYVGFSPTVEVKHRQSPPVFGRCHLRITRSSGSGVRPRDNNPEPWPHVTPRPASAWPRCTCDGRSEKSLVANFPHRPPTSLTAHRGCDDQQGETGNNNPDASEGKTVC